MKFFLVAIICYLMFFEGCRERKSNRIWEQRCEGKNLCCLFATGYSFRLSDTTIFAYKHRLYLEKDSVLAGEDVRDLIRFSQEYVDTVSFAIPVMRIDYINSFEGIDYSRDMDWIYENKVSENTMAKMNFYFRRDAKNKYSSIPQNLKIYAGGKLAKSLDSLDIRRIINEN